MKKLISIIYMLSIAAQQIHARTMNVMNFMSQQATITITTDLKNYSIQVNPSENNHLKENLDHASSQYDNQLSSLTYDGAIKKINIQRMQSDTPQIIYYNDEVTTDKNNKPAGIYANILSGTGSMKIELDAVTINNKVYTIHDLQSFQVKCKKIREMLASKNKDLNQIEHETNDLVESLRLIEQSDESSKIGLQISVIRLEVDALVNRLQIMREFKEYNANLQGVEKILTPENVDQVEEKLNNMATALQSVDNNEFQGLIDVEKIKKNMVEFQSKIEAIKKQTQLTDRSMLVEQ